LQRETEIPSKDFIDSVKQSIEEKVSRGSSTVEKGNLFLKWVVTKLFDVSEEEIVNQITDGKDDMGIDAWIKVEDETGEAGIIQLFQVKYGKSHQDQEILKFKEDIKQFLKINTTQIPRSDMQDLQLMIKRENLEEELYYVTDQKVDFKNTPKLIVYGFDQIIRKLWDDITGLPKDKTEKLKLEQVMEYDHSVIGVMSLKDLADFVNKTRSYIFESNIRKFLQHKTKVNRALKQTLEQDPKSVFYYNNGVTIVVKNFKLNGNEIELHEPQIVNGAQTSSTIADALRINQNVKGSIQVTIITETSQATREDITRFRNSQNAVKGKDLISLKVFHTRIRGALKQFGYYYEQQAGGWLNMGKEEKVAYTGHVIYNKYLPDDHDKRIIAKDAIQVMVAGIFQEPAKPYSSIARYMPDGKNYDEVFNSKRKEDCQLLLYPYLVKCYGEKEFGYGDVNAEPEQRRYARLLFVTAYFNILMNYILKKEPDEIKKDPALLEPYFKDIETNKRLLKFTDDVLKFYFSRARSYLEQNKVPTWHNFFSRHVWNDSLQTDFKSFVVDNKAELREIQKSFKS
jgi:hypothetical protein